MPPDFPTRLFLLKTTQNNSTDIVLGFEVPLFKTLLLADVTEQHTNRKRHTCEPYEVLTSSSFDLCDKTTEMFQRKLTQLRYRQRFANSG